MDQAERWFPVRLIVVAPVFGFMEWSGYAGKCNHAEPRYIHCTCIQMRQARSAAEHIGGISGYNCSGQREIENGQLLAKNFYL